MFSYSLYCHIFVVITSWGKKFKQLSHCLVSFVIQDHFVQNIVTTTVKFSDMLCGKRLPFFPQNMTTVGSVKVHIFSAKNMNMLDFVHTRRQESLTY